MNENMIKNEVKYLREHLREIYQYKSSMADLTYDMSLELLSRCCIAFDYLQQELQRKDNIINELKKHIGEEWYCYDNESIEFKVAKDILDKINELEERE